jgi:hypothetical protein
VLQALSGTVDLPATHFEPQIAMYCGADKQQAYHSQYMTETGHWVTDLNNKAKCLKDKVEILDYCKKVSLEYARSHLGPRSCDVAPWSPILLAIFRL